jgi:RNA polymerase sigma-70 factor, ECF subfamily
METLRRGGIDIDSDADLIASTKCGDAHAFEKLVSRYERRVFVLARRITSNREDAEDVLQESFCKAFLHPNDFQGKSLFSTWLTRIAMNEALAVLRRRRRELEVLMESSDHVDSVESTSSVFVDQSLSPEESCSQREHVELLAKAICELTPKIRGTILLRGVEQRSAKETAQILGISIGAVKSRAFHGRRKLLGTMPPSLLYKVCGSGPARA